MEILHGLFGLFILIFIAWLCSENRKLVPWRMILAGLGLQIAVAGLMLKVPAVKRFFLFLNSLVAALDEATRAGTSFVFGYVGGAPTPFPEPYPGASFILGFQALPLVILIGALTALLFYLKILPQVVRAFSFVLQKTMGIGGALGVGAGGCIFLGMVEAPLLIRPYLKSMTRSELFALMSVGMACIAGTVLVLYATILQHIIPDSLGQVLTASVIHAPAALLLAAVMCPESGEPTLGRDTPVSEASGAMDAIARGTSDGFKLYLNIIAMLIVFVALVKLCNSLLSGLPEVLGEPLTLERILGWGMAPAAWLAGIPSGEALRAGSLLGVKTILNELLAFMQLAKLGPQAFSEKTRLILTYAMCGFANPGSLGILIGGMGSLCPERRGEIVEMGLRSLLAGTLASLMTGAIVGILYEL